MDRTLDKIEFCKTTSTMTIKPSTESSEPATNPTIGFLVVVAFVVIFVVVVTFVVDFIVGFVAGSEDSVEGLVVIVEVVEVCDVVKGVFRYGQNTRQN